MNGKLRLLEEKDTVRAINKITVITNYNLKRKSKPQNNFMNNRVVMWLVNGPALDESILETQFFGKLLVTP